MFARYPLFVRRFQNGAISNPEEAEISQNKLNVIYFTMCHTVGIKGTHKQQKQRAPHAEDLQLVKSNAY